VSATMFGATAFKSREVSTVRRTENLSYVYQQVLTAVVRVRSNRQSVTDANTFRTNIQSALRAAERDANKKGYSSEDIRMATLGVVAFLDESILNSSLQIFSNWHSMPLQEEMFGHHVAGETFFENLDKLLSRPDSHETADVLEIYELCLLLGYKGRYGLSGPEAIRPLSDSALEKIRRIRGPLAGLSPSWAVQEGGLTPPKRASGIGGIGWAAILLLVLSIALFVGFRLRLGSEIAGIHAMAPITNL
jgi:type VI secretion system protein ImpK